jgi:hypothetical protein
MEQHILSFGKHVASDGTDGSSKMADIKKALESGLNMRSAIGQQFYREHIKASSPNHELYKTIQAGDNKVEATLNLKQDWLKAKYNHLLQAKEYCKKYQRVDSTKGVYKPFGRIVQDEGGWDDDAAVTGAKKLAIKCLMMGGNWIKYDYLTERTRLLHLEHSWTEEMTEYWSMFTKDYDNAVMKEQDIPEQDQLQTDDGQNPNKANTENKKPTAKGKGKGKGSDAGKGKGGNDKDKKKKDKDGNDIKDVSDVNKHEELFKQCQALKVLIGLVTSQAVSVMESIKTEEAWDWANTDKTLGVIKALAHDMKTSLSTFGKEFMLYSLQALQKKYGIEHVVMSLRAFQHAEPKAKSLKAALTRATAMHIRACE